jgi:hypothetical protein
LPCRFCREEGCYGSQPKASNLETIPYEYSPVQTARSGQESIAQGSPRVHPGLAKKRCLALKGRETRGNAAKVASRSSPCLAGPFRADSGWGKFTQGKPWAMLYWPLRAKDLTSGNLGMFETQGPMAMTKIAFWPQRTTLNTDFQNQINTSLET